MSGIFGIPYPTERYTRGELRKLRELHEGKNAKCVKAKTRNACKVEPSRMREGPKCVNCVRELRNAYSVQGEPRHMTVATVYTVIPNIPCRRPARK